MGDVTNINKLITALVQIEKTEREKADELRALYEKKSVELLQGDEKPKDKPKEK
jgi:hypothetical protein